MVRFHYLYWGFTWKRTTKTHNFDWGFFLRRIYRHNNEYHFTHLEYRPLLYSLPHQSLTLINIPNVIFDLFDPF